MKRKDIVIKIESCLSEKQWVCVVCGSIEIAIRGDYRVIYDNGGILLRDCDDVFMADIPYESITEVNCD